MSKLELENLNLLDDIYSDVLKNDGSFDTLKSKMCEYESIVPTCVNFLYSRFLYRKSAYQEASNMMDKAINLLNANNNFQLEHVFTETIKFKRALYLLAGEIYAYNKEPKKSLKAFQNYELITLSIKSFEDEFSFLSFRKFNEYTLSDLINNEITVCNPNVMNDPYDTLLLVWGEYLKQRKFNNKECYQIPIMCDSFKSYRIRSFTRILDKKGKEMVGNTLMWSHYADNHMGFCIKYKFSKSFLNVSEERRVIRCRTIEYKSNDNDINLERDTLNTTLGLCTKDNCWSYENEVRLITYEPDITGDFHAIPLDKDSNIDSIYFGYKCPEKHIETIRKLLSNQEDIKYYKMQSDYKDIYNLKSIELP